MSPSDEHRPGHAGCDCGSADSTDTGHPGHEHGQPGPLADASVRRARPTDAPAVGIVQLQAMRTDYAPVLPPAAMAALGSLDEADLARMWRDSLQAPPSPRHRLLVACAGDQVVGLAAFGPSDDRDADPETADLETLAVHPRARGQGHGSRLLNAAVDEARAAGFTWLTTWVPLDLPQMRAFVQAAGFGPDRARRQRAVDPDGNTLMEVRLGASLADRPENSETPETSKTPESPDTPEDPGAGSR